MNPCPRALSSEGPAGSRSLDELIMTILSNVPKSIIRPEPLPVPGPLHDDGPPLPPSSWKHLLPIDVVIERERERFLSLQHKEGHWVFDLEADATIPSEYVFLQRFLGNPLNPQFAERLARYLRRRQSDHGGWPLFTGGAADLSATVKAYFALKLLGDSPDAPHMRKAREVVLELGGAAKVNVFTRITLALFGQIPWNTTPAMPVEIVLLPQWFFFHLSKVSYWSRTVIVPLLLLYAHRPVCRLGAEEGVRELFPENPDDLRNLDGYIPGKMRKNLFIFLDRLLKRGEGLIPSALRKKAIRTAEDWTRKRMQGEGGIGAIFPAMANAVMALRVLGHPQSDPDFRRGMKAVDDLLLDRGEESLCQPCLSPIWDTCLSLSALMEAGHPADSREAQAAVAWLFDRQILAPGDWSERSPHLPPGGWAFQFENTLYPDVDDTPMVLMALLRAGAHTQERYRERLVLGVNWMLGLQSSDGGWGAFDIDNNYLYLNDIPFADHGALLDPTTSDVTARCVEILSMLGFDRSFPPLERALEFLRKEQEECGAWFGRWGVNYLYGTWSVLSALGQVGEDPESPWVRRAVDWVKSCQNLDGGWGESCDTYADPSLAGKGESSPSQTAWALLGLMAVGEVDDPAVQRGIGYLLGTQNPKGGWDETLFTGTGFPRVFYLRYHGYSQFFPLWALGVYRRRKKGEKTRQRQVSLESPPSWGGWR